MILVVEDDRTVSEFVSQILTSLGHEVVLAVSGEEALEILGQGRPIRLILLDLLLPGIDGNEFLDRMRNSGVTHPVVVLSGHLSALREDLRGTVQGMLAKPFHVREIEDLVQVALGASGESEHGGNGSPELNS